MFGRRLRAVLVITTLTTAGAVAAPATASAAGSTAPGAPGELSYFDTGRKDCVGTARTARSKVWYTVADGVLSDVYEPTIDNTNVHSLDFVVTDGRRFTDLQTRDLTYTARADATGMVCTVTATSAAHHYRLVSTYVTDPARDSVVISTRLVRTVSGGPALRVFARLDAHVNGNGGGGPDNGGGDTGGVTRAGVPYIGDSSTISQAVNRDYAVPTVMALDSTRHGNASVGYAGSASDGLVHLDRRHNLGARYTSAPNGHIVASLDVTPRGTAATTIALGFGRTRAGAVDTAAASLQQGSVAVRKQYTRGWNAYDSGLNNPFAGQRHPDAARVRAYWLSANVLKASEDKTFPGALAASLASPWGQAVSAGDLVGGRPVFFGSYRNVFARDLYEAATGLIATGDIATARAADRFLFERQQQPNGQMPRNSLINGRIAPDSGGDQLDESAYPILLAWLTGLAKDRTLYRQHIVPAADFVVSHGPAFGSERWEEQSGYSPSTIAAEIAGLTAASAIAHTQGDSRRARLYQAVADDFQRTVKAHTVTSNGPLSTKPYFVRLTKNGDPNSEYFYGLGNGSVNADQRAVVDGGFQELVRLGELPADDPVITSSLRVLDSTISEQTPTGRGYYRYGTAGPGTEDGYGDCWTLDPTDCPRDGQPWPTTDQGSGHLWPVLSGERAETALQRGDDTTVDAELRFMLRSASGVGLVPEQVWENPAVAADPYGTDPRTASIGFADGKAAGSASPLTWAQAQLARLIVDQAKGRITDRPSITTARYVTRGAPAGLAVTITAPADGAAASGTTTVTGTAPAGSLIDVDVVDTDTPGRSVRSTTTGSDGTWSVSVPVGFGTNSITATATAPHRRATGVARTSVVGALVGGTTVLDVTDPANDDHGPGTYQYPTASDFTDGSFDITRFEVLTKGDTAYLRTTLRNLEQTFGSTLGAQLYDVYIHTPSGATSNAAAYPQRHYTVADGWTQRIEVQGFASPVWVDADGNGVGTVGGVVASTSQDTITIALPISALGTPGPGWTFTLALTGQDGFQPDQARSFAATPQGYQFGVCPEGGTAAICSVDPSAVAKVMDTITPDGVGQSEEWNSDGSAVLRGVTVP